MMGRNDCRRQKGPGHHKSYHKTWTHKGSKKLNQPSDFSMHDSLRLPVLTQTTDFSTDQSFSRTMNPDMVPSSSSVSDDTMALGGRSLKKAWPCQQHDTWTAAGPEVAAEIPGYHVAFGGNTGLRL